MLIDPQFITRQACCILESATALLLDNGIPEPDRVDYIAHSPDVFPGCCSAMLLRDTNIVNVTPGDDDCGVHQVEIQWLLQFTDCMTIRDPQCLAAGDCSIESGNCRDVLRCPPEGEPYLFDGAPCTSMTKAEETDQISSAKWVLSSSLAAEVKACLCDPGSAPYPPECLDECGTPFGCQYVRFQQARSVDGGGCAGFVIDLRTRHIVS